MARTKVIPDKSKTKRLQVPIPTGEWQQVSDLMWAAIRLSAYTHKPIVESLRYLLHPKTEEELIGLS